MPHLRRFSLVFVLTVALPTLVAGVYYGLVGSDVYISESRFVVRNPEQSNPSPLGVLLQGTSLTRSSDDTYSVHDFVLSRDALRELDDKLAVRAAFSRPEIDILSRFPGLDWDASFENFHNYYQKRVQIGYDPTTSISVLRVRAFSADEARAINEQLLTMGERLVNNLNLRSRKDLIEVAEREVKAAESRAKSTALALSSFRTGRAVFDPNSQSALHLQAVGKLQEELIAVEAQLSELRRVAPANPQVAGLATRAEGLRKVIATESGKVTGGGPSLAAKAPDYDRLVLEKTFADRQLASALATLESARSEARRKQLYLERLVQPNLPDAPMEPRRLRSVVTVFLLGLVAWGVTSLVIAGVKEHVD